MHVARTYDACFSGVLTQLPNEFTELSIGCVREFSQKLVSKDLLSATTHAKSTALASLKARFVEFKAWARLLSILLAIRVLPALHFMHLLNVCGSCFQADLAVDQIAFTNISAKFSLESHRQHTEFVMRLKECIRERNLLSSHRAFPARFPRTRC